MFNSDNQCPKIPYFGLVTYINVQSLSHGFLQCWSNVTKMSDNRNDVHFSGVRLIFSLYLASLRPIITNETYALKTNIIGIILAALVPLKCHIPLAPIPSFLHLTTVKSDAVLV